MPVSILTYRIFAGYFFNPDLKCKKKDAYAAIAISDIKSSRHSIILTRARPLCL